MVSSIAVLPPEPAGEAGAQDRGRILKDQQAPAEDAEVRTARRGAQTGKNPPAANRRTKAVHRPRPGPSGRFRLKELTSLLKPGYSSRIPKR
ncbi:hypothetical protein HMPREF1545_00557 [Oscillibacter sp. KLE 1728]|nr:hypothetical protein HMPREF1545_00557 [Oscillibacter sp. KLE 1728]